MLLKPKLGLSIGLIFGGCFLAALGLGLWYAVGGYTGLIPGFFGVVGVLWILVGTVALIRRPTLVIQINEKGIDLPARSLFKVGSPRIFVRRDDIEAISRQETFRGRFIEIGTKNRGKLLVQVRHYCRLNQFISYCREYGLPVA